MGTATPLNLKTKNVLVTGGSRGLGHAIIKQLGAEQANVLFCSRTENDLLTAADELKRLFNPPQRLLAQRCDIAKEKDVVALFERLDAEFASLYAVINNAGVQKPIGAFDQADWKEWRKTVETNLFGTALVCRHAIPFLKRSGCGKIINLSGGGAATQRPNFSAYAASKAAVVRLTETLAAELREFNIDVNAVAPGALNTRLLDEMVAAGANKVGPKAHADALQQAASGGHSIEKAARLCVYLASPASDGITGKLISAQWDSWSELQQHRDILDSSDVYTIRRILPKDRGYDW